MKKIGILVGHYGEGTGAEYLNRDEWSLAKMDAEMLHKKIYDNGEIYSVLICIDKNMHPWKIIDNIFGLRGKNNIELRAAWGIDKEIDAAVELHYNSFSDANVNGHEVLIPRNPSNENRNFGRIINDVMTSRFPNKNRGVKESGILLMRLLSGKMPVAVIEPAFIFEDLVISDTWRETYVDLLSESIHKYLL